jgi:hypothetical protein
MFYFLEYVLLLHSNLQTYRVIDLLINNNRMSSAIAQISENKELLD